MSENLPEKPEQSARIIKAKQSGFAQGKQIEPHKKTTTELFEAQEDILSRLVKKSLKVFEKGMDSDVEKIAQDAAHRFMGHFYRPAQNVNVSGSTQNGDVNFNIVNIDGMSSTDRELYERAMKAKKIIGEEEEVIEGEIVSEEIESDS